MRIKVPGLTFGFKQFRSAVCAALCMLGVGTASATLLDRGPNMVYDDVLNITWTRQAGDGVERNWVNANAWAAGFFINDPTYGLIDDWRLPYASVSAPNGGVGPITMPDGQACTGAGGADEVACRDNEMAYMFYYNLDGTYHIGETGTQTAVGGEELTGILHDYWSGTEFDSSRAWYFLFSLGDQRNVGKSDLNDAWAVRPGDVAAAIPEPEIYAMMLAGLGLIGWVGRRRKLRERAR